VVAAVAADYWLLGLFGPLTLTETDSWAAAVFVDEFDADQLSPALIVLNEEATLAQSSRRN
jgi:hypothetical protein